MRTRADILSDETGREMPSRAFERADRSPHATCAHRFSSVRGGREARRRVPGDNRFCLLAVITDWGVDRAYARQGIGSRLSRQALDAAGGEENIVMYTCANEKTILFYEKMDMCAVKGTMEYNRVAWTGITVE